MEEGEHGGVVLGLFGAAGGRRGVEGDAVNINGGSEARVVIGAFSAVVVGR